MEFLILLGFIGALIALSLYERYENRREKQLEVESQEETELYDVSLYLDNGELFKQYHNVEVTHWDDNIYFFKNETVNDKVHKGSNVTMIRTRIDKIKVE